MRQLLAILFWSVIAAAFIGPGTVTTTASAGALFGFTLLWALSFSILATLVLQEASARLTVVSGRNLAQAIRAQYHGRPVGLIVLAMVVGAVVLGNAAYEAGNILGAAVGVGLGLGVSRVAVTLAIGATAFAVLWIGTPRAVARLLSVTVAVMGIAFLWTAVLLRPPLAGVASGAILPSVPVGSGLLILGLVGTTVVPYNLFLGSGIAAGQRLSDIRIGLGVAVLFGGLISMAILVAGTAVEGTFSFEALAATLRARLGEGAGALFAWGLFAAGYSSAITAPLAAAVTARGLFDDGRGGWEPTGWRYRAVWIGVLLVGVGFGVTEIRPIPAIILAQALNGVVLPFAAVFLLLAVNDGGLMGERGMNGRFGNALAALVVLVTMVLGTAGVMRAAAAALRLPAPGERLLLLSAAAVSLLLALPVARAVASRRRARPIAQPAPRPDRVLT